MLRSYSKKIKKINLLLNLLVHGNTTVLADCQKYELNVFTFEETPGIFNASNLLLPNAIEFDFFAHFLNEYLIQHLCEETDHHHQRLK